MWLFRQERQPRVDFHELNDGIQRVWELREERRPYPLRLFSGSRVGTGVSECHHESPHTQASDRFPQPRSQPHLHRRDCAEMHADWPATTPPVVGRKFKVFSSAQDTPHSGHQIPETLLLTASSSVMWQVKATPGCSLAGSWALALSTMSWASFPANRPPVARRGTQGKRQLGRN